MNSLILVCLAAVVVLAIVVINVVRGRRDRTGLVMGMPCRIWWALVLPFAALPARAQERAAEDSVRAVEGARAQALQNADTVALSRMVGNEFLEISRRGQIRTREENLREIASGDLMLTRVTYDSLTVRIYGDVAVLMGIADNIGRYRGLEFNGKIRYTRVFVRRAGRRQAVAMQQTPM